MLGRQVPRRPVVKHVYMMAYGLEAGPGWGQPQWPILHRQVGRDGDSAPPCPEALERAQKV